MTDSAALARQLAELDKVATPGPWTVDMESIDFFWTDSVSIQLPNRGHMAHFTRGLEAGGPDGEGGPALNHAALVVALRNNLPAILRALCVMAAVDSHFEQSKKVVMPTGANAAIELLQERADELLAECTGAK